MADHIVLKPDGLVVGKTLGDDPTGDDLIHLSEEVVSGPRLAWSFCSQVIERGGPVAEFDINDARLICQQCVRQSPVEHRV